MSGPSGYTDIPGTTVHRLKGCHFALPIYWTAYKHHLPTVVTPGTWGPHEAAEFSFEMFSESYRRPILEIRSDNLHPIVGPVGERSIGAAVGGRPQAQVGPPQEHAP